MNQQIRLLWIVAEVVCALIMIPACSSGGHAAKNVEERNASASPNAQIDMNCVGEHIENPPEAFHYSYRFTDAEGTTEKDADISPETMDVTIKDKTGSHSYHGVRSDSASWNGTTLDLTGSGLTNMVARVQFIKDNSATVRASSEAINGYQTTKYTIDTKSANSSDRQTFETMFGASSYDKGAIWVTAQGCPVKLDLDEALQKSNGVVDKVHYELAMVHK